MYRVMFTTPFPPTVQVAGAVSGFPFATTGYPVKREATTTGRQGPRAGLSAEPAPSVRSAWKATLVKRPAAGFSAASLVFSQPFGDGSWSVPHA